MKQANVRWGAARCGLVGCGVLAMWSLSVPAQAAAPKVAWRTSLQAALQEAKRTKKPVMVDLWATWCSPCRAMDDQTYTNAGIVRESRKWVPVKVDIDAYPQIAQRYGLKTPPTLVFLKADGSVSGKFVGYTNAAGLMKQMKQAYAKARRK